MDSWAFVPIKDFELRKNVKSGIKMSIITLAGIMSPLACRKKKCDILEK